VLYERYAERLRAVAGGGPDPAWCDPEDVVQSAFRSFIARAVEGHYAVPDEKDLWALLVTVVLNKRRTHVRQAAAARRADAAHEARTPPPRGGSEPAVVGGARDLLDRLPPAELEVAELRLAGCSVDEIAARLGKARRTVERNLHSCRERIQREVAPDE
jgi:RNA polymerase sigma factor (sigma-70 family)